MTTEILRDMIYRGAETMSEVTTVIFDEIHYMAQKQRFVPVSLFSRIYLYAYFSGIVWEETIVLINDAIQVQQLIFHLSVHIVRLIFLSG